MGWEETQQSQDARHRALFGYEDGKGVGPKFFLTDAGNAERFAEQHGDRLRFVPEWNDWIYFDDKRWQRGAESAAHLSAVWTARFMLREASEEKDSDRRGRLTRHAGASESLRGVSNTVRMAQHLLSTRSSELDVDRMLLNVENGTIDLETGELELHYATDLITRLAPIAFDPKATAPQFERFLEKILPSPDVRGFVRRFFGYALTGCVGEQVLAFFHGAGANGKSTLLTVIQHILGDYAVQGAPDLLLQKHGETHPTEQADLEGARLVICSEVEAGRRLAEVRVKQITGGDKIRARRMRQDFYEFNPTHKLILAANHRPQVRGADHAIWRRVLMVPFEVTIPAGDRDPQLAEKLKAEAPGILAWMVQGCLEWQEQGLAAPAEVKAATETYREDQDHLGQFLADRCELAPDAWAPTADLLRAYGSWCAESQHRPWETRQFTDGLSDHGLKSARERCGGKQVRGWCGVRLKVECVSQPAGVVSLSERLPANGGARRETDQDTLSG